MSDLTIPPTNDVSALKKLEKKIIKEGKNEDSRVSHDLKDLTKLEKASGKAAKDLEAKKAEAARLEAELAKKKDSVNGVVEGQRQHNSLRETKLAEIHHVRAGTTSSTTNTNTNPAPNATGTYTDTIASSPASHTGPSAATCARGRK
ncbi:hypothetical protein BT96DRAFT_938899 [Gymnopus androsaceus JB14]|uniref:Uncharacterized protein n=1 Tax=Gymnopus androsaceus JB14 TaxID=1447944 RepID=A0A6A4HQV5_9AGAR|nr:hypothetical protein BT96DRAFT_938899 [Gymnopus androsaceus JB14]